MRYEMKAETESQKCVGISFRKLKEAMKSNRLTAADMEMLHFPSPPADTAWLM